MARSFVLARQNEIPAWIDDETGRAYQAAMAAHEDENIRLLKAGVLGMLIETAPDDALDFVGSNFDLPRFIGESNDHYRVRIEAAWDSYDKGGTDAGVIGILEDMEIVDVDVLEDHEWEAAPGDWYTRFWPVIGPDFGPVLQTLPMTTPFETPCTMGSTATRAEILQIKREIRKWKGPTGYPVHVILAWEGAPIQGLVTTPFETGPVAAYVPIGKLQGVTVTTAPFTPGGFLE